MQLHTVFTALILTLALPAQQPAPQPAPSARVEAARAAAAAAWKAHDREAVVTAYRRLVELEPDETAAWHRLGFALHQLGRYDEALAANERAATLW